MENKKNLTEKKSAMTLAEILIVVVIVAIIGCLFLAMPRKNVSALDKTKYYIAYMTLYRLLSEQVAANGKIVLKTNSDEESCTTDDEDLCNELEEKFDTSNGKTFQGMVGKWLSVVSSCTWSGTPPKCTRTTFNSDSSTNAILSNGLYLDWSGSSTKQNDITTGKVVYIDIDGPDEGRGIDQKDKHYFLLYRNEKNGEIRVRPIASDGPEGSGNNGVPDNNSTWITFKVFTVDNNGNTKIQLLDQNYTKAYNCYDSDGNTGSAHDACPEGGSSNKCRNTEAFEKMKTCKIAECSGGVDDDTPECAEKCKKEISEASVGICFIEPIPPLK